MNSGHKQRPPQWLQYGAPSSDNKQNHNNIGTDPWATKERYGNDNFTPKTIMQRTLSTPVVNSEKSDKTTNLPPTASLDDLDHVLNAYDGTPIIIVPPSHFDIVAGSFKAGLYGLDTESDCVTGELRIIQIYTKNEVYIFPASVLDNFTDNLFVKFLRSKDRIKVGVDIDNDISVLRRHINKKTPVGNGNRDRHLRNMFTVNGIIDVQTIARSISETLLSLDKLSDKYVEDFIGNDCTLGTFNPPTNEQYVYAANDAILSLKIYEPLRTGRPSKRWRIANGCFVEEMVKQKPLLIRPVLPGTRDPTVFESAARAIFAEEVREQPEEKREGEKEERAKTPEPDRPEPKKSSGKKSKKKKQSKADVTVVTQTKPTRNTVSPELQRKFKEKMLAMRNHRIGKCDGKCDKPSPDTIKRSASKDLKETKELFAELESAKNELSEAAKCLGKTKASLDLPVKTPTPEEELKSDITVFLSAMDPLFPAKRKLKFSSDHSTGLTKPTTRLLTMKKVNEAGGQLAIEASDGKEMLDEIIDRLIDLTEQFGEDQFYAIMGRLTVWMLNKSNTPQTYGDVFLYLVALPEITERYDGDDRILVSSVFINMCIDNDYLEAVGETHLHLITIH